MSVKTFRLSIRNDEEETLEQTKSLMQKLYNKDNPFETQILCPSRKGEAGIRKL